MMWGGMWAGVMAAVGRPSAETAASVVAQPSRQENFGVHPSRRSILRQSKTESNGP